MKKKKKLFMYLNKYVHNYLLLCWNLISAMWDIFESEATVLKSFLFSEITMLNGTTLNT